MYNTTGGKNLINLLMLLRCFVIKTSHYNNSCFFRWTTYKLCQHKPKNKIFYQKTKNNQQLLMRMKKIWPASFIIHTTKKESSVLTLSYSSKINSNLYLQRVSWLWKKTLRYILRGQCCPSSRVWQPSADSNGCLAHFLLNFNLLDRTWQPSAESNGRLKHFRFEKSGSNGDFYLQRVVTPYKIGGPYRQLRHFEPCFPGQY